MRKISYKALFSFLVLVMIAGILGACGSGSKNTSANGGASNSSQSDYPTKDITIIVPYSAGGGFDTAARMLAPFMEKYLPNNVSVVVKNKPGGKGNIALGDLSKSDPDGYKIGLVNLPGHAVNQIVGQASYDLKKFDYIGNITKTVYVAAASKDSGIKKLKDLQNADQVTAGITNVSSTDGLGMVLAIDKLGINAKTINHEGSTEAVLAATRGDVDLVQYPYESIKKYFDSGELIPLWVYNDKRLDGLPDTPTMEELGYSDLNNSIALNRALATTPGTPDNVLNVLRDAFQKAVDDPDYKKKVKDAGAFWNPGDYKQVQTIVKNSFKMIEPKKNLIKDNM